MLIDGMDIDVATYMTGCKTRVFWDFVDFPVPDGGDIRSLKANVEKALEEELYYGQTTIVAYGDFKSDLQAKLFRGAEIPRHGSSSDKLVRHSRMLRDMLEWRLSTHTSDKDLGDKSNLLVAAKDIDDPDSILASLLCGFVKDNYNVFLVVPDGEGELPPCYKKLVDTSLYVWRWGSLFSGGPPIPVEDSDSECAVEGSSQGSKRPQCDEGSSRVAKSQKTDDAADN